jgi:hypothetical protein
MWFLGKIVHDFSIDVTGSNILDFTGKPGTAWSQGTMPSFVSGKEMFFTGWNLGGDNESSSKSCMCYMDLGTNKINVLLERDDNDIGCSMPTIQKNTLYYMSFQAWKNKEALYSIRQCGIYFDTTGKERYVLRNFKDVISGGFCYARPVPFKDSIFCCFREFGKRNYKGMVLTKYHDQWLPTVLECEDSIVAYPYPFQLTNDDKVYCLYNNDESLRGNIQIAEVIYD